MNKDITLLKDQSEILPYKESNFPLYVEENKIEWYESKRVRCHWHHEIEFFLVLKGHPSYFVNGTTIDLKEDEAIFVNSKVVHYGFSKDGSNSTYLVMVFDPSLVTTNNLVKDKYFSLLIDNPSIPFFVLPKEVTHKLKEELFKMIRIFKDNETNYELKVLSSLYAFMDELCKVKDNTKTVDLGSNSKSDLIKEMLFYIYKNYENTITVNDIASSANLSVSYALHLFKSAMNTSPIEYLVSYRLDKASLLLTDSNYNITEVANNVGFTDASYFARKFKEEKGLTPKEYRNKNIK